MEFFVKNSSIKKIEKQKKSNDKAKAEFKNQSQRIKMNNFYY